MTRYPSPGEVARLQVGDLGTVHLIAIGGSGMSVVAHLLLDRGVRVQGSDMHESATTAELAEAGATVWLGHDGDHVAGADTVVVSSAIRDDNVELVAAARLGLRILHRSQALAILMHGLVGVAVAGAHGKTTSSAMIAAVLTAVGADPSTAIGASVRTGSAVVSGGHAGGGRVLVAEADESDGSFLNYSPAIAVVTNIEPDHLDHYGTVAAFEEAFVRFSERIEPGGVLIACADDPGAARLLDRVRASGGRTVSYGMDELADVRLTDIRLGAAPDCDLVARAEVAIAGTTVDLGLLLPGAHNLLNAAAALAVAVELGYAAQPAAAALAQFRGTGRRFDEVGSVAGVRVLTDYAHHPTEVAALLAAARSVADGGRVLVAFQPHLYSRTVTFAERFAVALAAADLAIVCDVYGAREDPQPGVGPATITDKAPSGARLEQGTSPLVAARRLASLAEAGDLILLVGAGDVNQAAAPLLDMLAGRA